MKERYRDRSGRILTLSYEQLSVLDLTKSVVVDIGDQRVELYVDGFQPMEDTVDKHLALSPDVVERLYSGYTSRFYGVLDGEGDGDLVVEAEDRPKHEFAFADGEYRSIDIDEQHVDENGVPVTQ